LPHAQHKNYACYAHPYAQLEKFKMTEPEKIFNFIVNKIQFGIGGKMFGARCVKSSNGKTAVFFGKIIWFSN